MHLFKRGGGNPTMRFNPKKIWSQCLKVLLDYIHIWLWLMFWGLLPVKNQSSSRQGVGQMGSRIWASLLIWLDGESGLNHDTSLYFLWLPTWNTTKSQASPTGTGNLPPVELETRTNSCWGKLAPRENKGSVCPYSVLSPNHQMWVPLPCGKWVRVRERQRLQLLLRSRSYYLMRQALGGRG